MLYVYACVFDAHFSISKIRFQLVAFELIEKFNLNSLFFATSKWRFAKEKGKTDIDSYMKCDNRTTQLYSKLNHLHSEWSGIGENTKFNFFKNTVKKLHDLFSGAFVQLRAFNAFCETRTNSDSEDFYLSRALCESVFSAIDFCEMNATNRIQIISWKIDEITNY